MSIRKSVTIIFGSAVVLMSLITMSQHMDMKIFGQLYLPVSGTITVSSLVDGVKVTAVNATGVNTIIANLSFNGSKPSPAIALIGTAMNLSPEDVSSLMSAFLQGASRNIDMNSTQAPPITLPASLQVLTGTDVVDAGWESPTSETVTLIGNTTLNDADFISVQVLPFTG